MKNQAGHKNRIKELREERGISSRALAQKLGTSAAQMSRLESGKSALSIKWILSIAKILNVPTNEIMNLPLNKQISNNCDDALLGSAIGWLLEASERQKMKLSRQELSRFASFVYKEAIERPLSFKDTQYLAGVVVRVLKKAKER